MLAKAALRDIHFPPFKASFDAGALTVMSAFNDVAGCVCVWLWVVELMQLLNLLGGVIRANRFARFVFLSSLLFPFVELPFCEHFHFFSRDFLGLR